MTAKDPARELLRHTLATLAYRAAKPLRGAPPEFAAFRPSPSSRTAGEILTHMCDLMDWALQLTHGQHVYNVTPVQAWDKDCQRFFDAMAALDAMLAGPALLGRTPEVLFQGPIADALQHTGQLTYLRRLSGAPIKGESYARAEIVAGRVGAEQAKAKVEFD
jgi:hypothetical protein